MQLKINYWVIKMLCFFFSSKTLAKKVKKLSTLRKRQLSCNHLLQAKNICFHTDGGKKAHSLVDCDICLFYKSQNLFFLLKFVKVKVKLLS